MGKLQHTALAVVFCDAVLTHAVDLFAVIGAKLYRCGKALCAENRAVGSGMGIGVTEEGLLFKKQPFTGKKCKMGAGDHTAHAGIFDGCAAGSVCIRQTNDNILCRRVFQCPRLLRNIAVGHGAHTQSPAPCFHTDGLVTVFQNKRFVGTGDHIRFTSIR